MSNRNRKANNKVYDEKVWHNFEKLKEKGNSSASFFSCNSQSPTALNEADHADIVKQLPPSQPLVDPTDDQGEQQNTVISEEGEHVVERDGNGENAAGANSDHDQDQTAADAREDVNCPICKIDVIDGIDAIGCDTCCVVSC